MALPVITVLPKNATAIMHTVGSNNSISGSALVALDDASVASGSYITRRVFAGITAAEKDPLDGSTKLGVYPPGSGLVIDVEASGAIPVGGLVMLSGANKVSWMAADPTSGANVMVHLSYKVGRAQETATDGETFEVLI